MNNGEYEWAQFGKLPLHSAWDFAKMDEFSQKPTVSLSRVKVLCELLEKKIPQDVLDRHNLHKKSLGEKPIVDGFFFLVTPTMQKRLEAKYGEDWRRRHWPNGYQNEEECWLPTECYRPKRLPRTEAEALQETLKKQNPPKAPRESQPVPIVKSIPHKTPSQLNLDFSDVMNEPDSFKRQQRALVRFARYLKRVPTVEEALTLIRHHRLFSGSWEEHEAKRRIRVNSILEFISQTFDASSVPRVRSMLASTMSGQERSSRMESRQGAEGLSTRKANGLKVVIGLRLMLSSSACSCRLWSSGYWWTRTRTVPCHTNEENKSGMRYTTEEWCQSGSVRGGGRCAEMK